MIRACDMMQLRNIRAKLFISVNLIDQPGYCTWNDLYKLANYHDIENHGAVHELMTEMDVQQVYYSISYANKFIKQETRRQPRYFAAPWNQTNAIIEKVCKDLGLQVMRDRINIKNDSR
jgi:peptidoglycan/xylan/chitin deacetylase (PgdA/CDA1 family)